ncbi:MAG: ABC transporter permease, partial [Gemmatimonadota bacterium]
MKLLTRASVRYLLHHRIQLILSVLGVALGVAVVLSIDLATESARTGFRISAETVSGRATHQIVSDVAPLDDGIVARLRARLGLRESAPVVEGFASSPRLPGQALRILGIDPFSEGPFRPFVVGGGLGADVSDFVTTPRGVVVSGATAERAGLSVGDTLPVLVEGEAWSLPVVGTVAPTDALQRTGLGDVLLMDVSGAQEVLGMVGGLTRVDLRLPAGPEGETMVAEIEGLLEPGASVLTTGTRTDTMSGMIDAFDVNLTALSLLALIFGMFLIYNAVTFSVVQRRALLSRLRAIGVTRGEVLRVILVEAVWVG